MINLVYKELKLSINRFFYIIPFLLGLLMFIPNWIFTLIFMYFFWISVPNIYASYIGQQDYSFTAMLPISKKEVALSKVYSLWIMEGLHLVFGFLFGIIHIWIYGQYNFFFDINVAFFGLILVLFAIFNFVFLPMYFKTGYAYGKPVIYAIIVTLVYGFLMEFSLFKFEWARELFEGTLQQQFLVLLGSVIVTIILSIITVKKSISNFQNIS